MFSIPSAKSVANTKLPQMWGTQIFGGFLIGVAYVKKTKGIGKQSGTTSSEILQLYTWKGKPVGK